MRLHMLTHKSFYTQKLLHKEAFTHRKLLHTGTFTQRTFTQRHFYRDNFTYRSFYTETLVRIDWQQNAQSTSQYYFVLQHFHNALPSTTLYYKYNGHFQLQAWKQWLIKHLKKCEKCEKHILKMRLEQNVKNAFQTCEKSVKNCGKCWKQEITCF